MSRVFHCGILKSFNEDYPEREGSSVGQDNGVNARQPATNPAYTSGVLVLLLVLYATKKAR